MKAHAVHRARLDRSRIRPIGFAGVADYVANNEARIALDFSTYFTANTGRLFEEFSRLGAPNEFDANDVAACAALSVPLDGATLNRLWLKKAQLDLLLAESAKRDVTLADVDTDSTEYERLDELYRQLRKIRGLGYVRASKILASKRPQLVPIRDTYVEVLLGKPKLWWKPWRDVVSNEPLVGSVRGLAAGVTPADVSDLRLFDVMLWMEADRQARDVRSQA